MNVLNLFSIFSAKKFIKYVTGTTWIDSCKSNGMSKESIGNITKSNSNFAATFVDHYLLPNISFNGHYLLKNNISIPEKLINLYISYILSPWSRNLNTDFTLNNCLFGFVKLTKNADPDKYKCSGYLILVQNFHLQLEAWEEMLLFLVLIWPHLCILIIMKNIS